MRSVIRRRARAKVVFVDVLGCEVPDEMPLQREAREFKGAGRT